MKTFKSHLDYLSFAHSVRSERRYVHTRETRAFLQALVDSAKRRAEQVPPGAYLWRAQKGCSTIEIPIGGDDTAEEDYPYPRERMRPLVGRAKEGRANPKGIPYLYLATDRDIAVAEVRPWKGGAVSVGQFRTNQEIRLVNTTLDAKRKIFFGEPRPKEREISVWGHIDHAFALPTEASDDTADYIPTQIIAESLRDAGFDGVAYKSAYGKGHNLVLFTPELATQVNCFVVRITDISFEVKLNEQFSYGE